MSIFCYHVVIYQFLISVFKRVSFYTHTVSQLLIYQQSQCELAHGHWFTGLELCSKSRPGLQDKCFTKKCKRRIITYVYQYHKVLTFNQASKFKSNSHLLKNINACAQFYIFNFEILPGSLRFSVFWRSCANMAAM